MILHEVVVTLDERAKILIFIKTIRVEQCIRSQGLNYDTLHAMLPSKAVSLSTPSNQNLKGKYDYFSFLFQKTFWVKKG